ncbi:hypothetical protein [Prevotella jejuni]
MEKVKRAYAQPACGFVYTEIETLMNQASGSAGTIGHGSQAGDVKQAPVWMDNEEDEEEEKSSWVSTRRSDLWD